jgi:hypothetical protein
VGAVASSEINICLLIIFSLLSNAAITPIRSETSACNNRNFKTTLNQLHRLFIVRYHVTDFMEIEIHFRVYRSLLLVPILMHLNPVHSFEHIGFNIIIPSTPVFP